MTFTKRPCQVCVQDLSLVELYTCDGDTFLTGTFLVIIVTDYVIEHWRDDDFFGYQFLNGANPNIIQRCSGLPVNFPVTEEMVKPFLAYGSSLAIEMTVLSLY